MKLTNDIIEAGRSSEGGWSEEQLRLIGVGWPPYPGWKRDKVGAEVADEKVAEFLRLKDAHIG